MDGGGVAVGCEGAGEGFIGCATEELQGGVGDGFVEDLEAFEVEPAVEGTSAADELAEGFAVFVDHPDVGSDVAHAAFSFEQADGLFDKREIHVEVAALGAGVDGTAVGVFGFDEIGGGVGLGAAEVLELDVGRIADHAVEAAVAEDVGEGGAPVESVDAHQTRRNAQGAIQNFGQSPLIHQVFYSASSDIRSRNN